jgi:hypothetical protein
VSPVIRSIIFLGELSDRPFGDGDDRLCGVAIVFTRIRLGVVGVGQL